METKIRVLREAADYLEANPERYEWLHPSRCNCGILARVAGNMSQNQLNDIVNKSAEKGKISWSTMAKNYAICRDTGLPIVEVLQILMEAGFSLAEMSQIEYLKDPTLRKVLRTSSFATAENVILYFRAWADLLQQELNQQNVFSVQETKVQVGV